MKRFAICLCMVLIAMLMFVGCEGGPAVPEGEGGGTTGEGGSTGGNGGTGGGMDNITEEEISVFLAFLKAAGEALEDDAIVEDVDINEDGDIVYTIENFRFVTEYGTVVLNGSGKVTMNSEREIITSYNFATGCTIDGNAHSVYITVTVVGTSLQNVSATIDGKTYSGLQDIYK